MFKNVLVGVDGAPGGRDTIALARKLVDSAGTLTLAGRQREAASIPCDRPGMLREESVEIRPTIRSLPQAIDRWTR